MGPDGAGLSWPGSSVVAEGARFETPDAIETIGRDLLSSIRIQSLTEESEADETPIKHDRTRSCCHSLATDVDGVWGVGRACDPLHPRN